MAEEDEKKMTSEGSDEVDEQKAQDETEDNQDQNLETSNESQGEHDSEVTTVTDPEWWSPDKKRFTQFKGENLKEYFDNLENAYANSYKEVERIRSEKLAELANSDSGAASKKDSAQKAQTATDIWAAQEMKRRHAEQYASFADKHPEVNTDDELFNRLDKETGRYMNYVFETEERIPDLSESLNWAWNMISPNDAQSSRDEKIAQAAKNTGAASKSKSATKDMPKTVFTDKQIEAARRIDPSLRDKSRAEVEEILAKYTK